jgi:branched-subunit amino acid transport protein AzlD
MAVRRPTAAWALLTIAYLAFACLYNALIPLGYGPDEAHHYGYIQHLVLYRSLPVLGPQDHPILCHRDPRPPMAIGIHPPLYYALLAPIYALIAGRRIDYPAEAARKTPFPLLPRSRSELAQRLLRSISLLMGLLTLLCLARLVALLTDDAWRQFAVVGFVALLPHFLMLGAVMNNDNLAILTGTLFLLLLVRQIIRPSEPLREAMQLGFVGGAMLLSKASLLAWLPLLFFGAWQSARRLPTAVRWRAWLLTLAIPALLSGWWYVRFYLLYGRIMPIVQWTYEPQMLFLSPTELFTQPEKWWLIWRFLSGSHRSLWGQVDWFLLKPEHVALWHQKFRTDFAAAYPVSEPIYALLVLLTVAMLAGWLIRLGRWWRNRQWTPKRLALAVLAAAFVLLYGALMHYTLFTHPGGYEGGRYLLPAIGAFSVLFWWGITALVPTRWHRPLIATVLALLVALNLCCAVNLHTFLNPLYAPR